jgi:light-harvesting complex I chlorophyll a/b binding protein 4
MMMMKSLVASLLVVSCGAFAPPSISSTGRSTTALNEMSKALPFLLKPKNLDGYVGGEVGFDPLGFSEHFDMKWLRESEIKHGRTCMLASLGFVMQQFWTLPGMTHVDNANDAPAAAGWASMMQIVLWMGVLEFWTNKGNVTMENMFSDPKRIPGNLGFDPMGLGGKNGASEDMQLKEITNGRLAMLAIGGMIHHNIVVDGPLF